MIGAEADALAVELVAAFDQPLRVLAIAARLAALAAQAHAQKAAVVPPHLREAPPVFPPNVSAIWAHGRWYERNRRSPA